MAHSSPPSTLNSPRRLGVFGLALLTPDMEASKGPGISGQSNFADRGAFAIREQHTEPFPPGKLSESLHSNRAKRYITGDKMQGHSVCSGPCVVYDC